MPRLHPLQHSPQQRSAVHNAPLSRFIYSERGSETSAFGHIHMQIYSSRISMCPFSGAGSLYQTLPRHPYTFTARGTVQREGCCRRHREKAHKLNDVNAVSTLRRSTGCCCSSRSPPPPLQTSQICRARFSKRPHSFRSVRGPARIFRLPN